MRLPEWDDLARRNAALGRVAQRLATPDPLNKSELAVLFLESHGVPRGLQAEWLHLSAHTVRGCLKTARAKLFAASSEHAVATALRMGLIE